MKNPATGRIMKTAGAGTRPAPLGLLPDPRTLPGFDPSLHPTVNGSPTFPGNADPDNDRIVIQFLAAYYEINRTWTALRALRAEPRRPAFQARERVALERIETALRRRDELEDHYAPLGVVAEPFTEEGITTDVHFTFGSTRETGQFRSQPIVYCADLHFERPAAPRNQGFHPPGPPLTNATVLPLE